MKINNRWSKVYTQDQIYLPSIEPNGIISKNTQICSMGSCFADNIGWALLEKKLNIGDVEVNHELKHVLYPWGTFFNTGNLKNIIFHALEKKRILFNEDTFLKVSPNLKGNNYISKTSYKEKDFKLVNLIFKNRSISNNLDDCAEEIKKKINLFKDNLIKSEVIIITLGLIETWIDNKTNLTWHSFHGDPIKKKAIDERASFKILDFQENLKNLKDIIETIKELDKNKKIILTISPIPLAFTFTSKDVVIANRYSKSLLRSVVEKFVDNKEIFYFPSFEIITDCIGFPKSYAKDFRHINVDYFKEYIAPLFIKTFCKL